MQNRYDFIISLIKEAGQKLFEVRDAHIETSTKNGDERDLVTNVDIEVNTFVVSKIQEAYPDDKIYTEEDGGEGVGNFWSIDPIDGTSNFARGLPHYAVVISYLEKREPIVGAIFNPVTRELFSFEKGKGAFLNGNTIKTTSVTTIKDSYVLLHIGRKDDVQEWGLHLQKHFLKSAKKNINLGSSALDLAFLAAGRVDAVIYGTMTTLDVAVAVALVRAAGGEVYSPDGMPIMFTKVPQKIVGTATKALFDEISKI
jgi:myo-inositol-1(or 4)-monophosphatase